MKQTANARFAIKNWDEKPYSEGQDLPKLTRASVTKTFTGDIEGSPTRLSPAPRPGSCSGCGARAVPLSGTVPSILSRWTMSWSSLGRTE
jgi:hypothetical protein